MLVQRVYRNQWVFRSIILPASSTTQKRRKNNEVEWSPWEADGPSASQEISRLLWNPKFHCCIRNVSQLVPILSQINAVHVLTSYFFTVSFNIIPIYSYVFQVIFFFFFHSGVPTLCTFISPMIAIRPVHFVLLNLIHIMNSPITQFSPGFCYSLSTLINRHAFYKSYTQTGT